MKVVFLDFETTGLDPQRNAVWAVAAMQAYFDPVSFRVYPKRKVVRYYHVPLERAYDVCGYWRFDIRIYRDVVKLLEVERLRRGEDVVIRSKKGDVSFKGRESFYDAETFNEDISFWKGFLRWGDVIVSHNVSFEDGFLRSYGLRFNRWFCTMVESNRFCGLTRVVSEWNDFYEEYEFIEVSKWPKLSEACRILLNWNGKGNFHNPEFDLKALTQLFPVVYMLLKQKSVTSITCYDKEEG